LDLKKNSLQISQIQIAAYIQNLPLNYSPGVLGLHSNADVEHNKRCLVELVANLMKMQPQPG
jgi:hypothetical protein